ncbi:MAG: hypothetical protein ACYS26_03160 [Planctomycetota bacterium]
MIGARLAQGPSRERSSGAARIELGKDRQAHQECAYMGRIQRFARQTIADLPTHGRRRRRPAREHEPLLDRSHVDRLDRRLALEQVVSEEQLTAAQGAHPGDLEVACIVGARFDRIEHDAALEERGAGVGVAIVGLAEARLRPPDIGAGRGSVDHARTGCRAPQGVEHDAAERPIDHQLVVEGVRALPVGAASLTLGRTDGSRCGDLVGPALPCQDFPAPAGRPGLRSRNVQGAARFSIGPRLEPQRGRQDEEP